MPRKTSFSHIEECQARLPDYSIAVEFRNRYWLDQENLEAALEVLRYVEDSARYVFGDLIGNRTADRILASLRAKPDGITRTSIIQVFKNHLGATELSNALQLLKELGYADYRTEPTEGRPCEVWYPL